MTIFAGWTLPTALAGMAAAAMLTTGLATPGHAMMTAAQFMATISEVKPICRKLEQPFWDSTKYYGCGDEIRCSKHSKYCYRYPKEQQQPMKVLCLSYACKQGDGSSHEGRSKGGHEAGHY